MGAASERHTILERRDEHGDHVRGHEMVHPHTRVAYLHHVRSCRQTIGQRHPVAIRSLHRSHRTRLGQPIEREACLQHRVRQLEIGNLCLEQRQVLADALQLGVSEFQLDGELRDCTFGSSTGRICILGGLLSSALSPWQLQSSPGPGATTVVVGTSARPTSNPVDAISSSTVPDRAARMLSACGGFMNRSTAAARSSSSAWRARSSASLWRSSATFSAAVSSLNSSTEDATASCAVASAASNSANCAAASASVRRTSFGRRSCARQSLRYLRTTTFELLGSCLTQGFTQMIGDPLAAVRVFVGDRTLGSRGRSEVPGSSTGASTE